MQSTVSVLMAAIVFIVEFFSGILSSASATPYKPDKPAVSSTLTVFSRNDEFSDLVGKY